MVRPVKALGSVITIVIFFVLIAVSTVLYGGDPEQKVKMEQNFFWRNAKAALDSIGIAIQGIADIGLGKDYGRDTQNSEAAMATTANDSGFFQRVGADIKEEWNKDGDVRLDSVSTVNLNKVWRWQATDSGADIIFRDKNGEDHIISLPFKFLAQQPE